MLKVFEGRDGISINGSFPSNYLISEQQQNGIALSGFYAISD